MIALKFKGDVWYINMIHPIEEDEYNKNSFARVSIYKKAPNYDYYYGPYTSCIKYIFSLDGHLVRSSSDDCDENSKDYPTAKYMFDKIMARYNFYYNKCLEGKLIESCMNPLKGDFEKKVIDSNPSSKYLALKKKLLEKESRFLKLAKLEDEKDKICSLLESELKESIDKTEYCKDKFYEENAIISYIEDNNLDDDDVFSI